MTHVTEHDQERAAIEAAHEAVGRLMDEWMEMNRELRAIGRGRPYDGAHPDCPIQRAKDAMRELVQSLQSGGSATWKLDDLEPANDSGLYISECRWTGRTFICRTGEDGNLVETHATPTLTARQVAENIIANSLS